MSDKKTMTFNDLEQWLNERRVTEVECLVPDLTGVARGKILPREPAWSKRSEESNHDQQQQGIKPQTTPGIVHHSHTGAHDQGGNTQ